MILREGIKMLTNNFKKAQLMKKDGLVFHLYETTDGKATIYYFPRTTDKFFDSWDGIQHPNDIVEYEEIPSELILFKGSYENCKRWFNDKEDDAHILCLASLERLDDKNNYGLSFYISRRPYSGDTSIDDSYRKKGLELY